MYKRQDLLLTVNSVGNFLLKGVSTTEFDPNQHILFNDKTPPNAPTSLTTTSSITNNTTPTITGTAEEGSTVKLYNGSTLLGSATAGSNGAFSITSSILSYRNYSLTSTATDAAGNISDSSIPLSVTIQKYVFNTRTELDKAVSDWISDESSAKEIYGEINTWDVSAITDFSKNQLSH